LAEAFARAMERGSTVRDPLPYIYRTAFRLASAELRLDRRRGALRTERVAIEAPDLVDLIRALDALPAKQRAVVILHDEEGYSAVEVARLIGVAPAARRAGHAGRARRRGCSATGPSRAREPRRWPSGLRRASRRRNRGGDRWVFHRCSLGTRQACRVVLDEPDLR